MAGSLRSLGRAPESRLSRSVVLTQSGEKGIRSFLLAILNGAESSQFLNRSLAALKRGHHWHACCTAVAARS
jgi:hypothetical protein